MSLQAQRGYVYDGTVMKATWALHDVPARSASDPITAYSKQRAEAFAYSIAGVVVSITMASIPWDLLSSSCIFFSRSFEFVIDYGYRIQRKPAYHVRYYL